MKTEPASILLITAGILFALFLILKMFRPPAPRPPEWQEAKRKVDEAKKRARDSHIDTQQRAKAWREAALGALEGMRNPGLAASYARRAERLDPSDNEAVQLMVAAMRRAARYRALERFLWRRLAEQGEKINGQSQLLRELLGLYEGPLRRPEIASGLRRLVDIKSTS